MASTIATKKAEIDLLRSIFDSSELVFTDSKVLQNFDYLFDKGILHEDCDIDFVLKPNYPECSSSFSLSICLPIGYPSKDVKPTFLLRLEKCNRTVDFKRLNNDFCRWLTVNSLFEDPIVCSAVDWIRQALSLPTYDMVTISEGSSVSSKEPNLSMVIDDKVCLWIVSHHIRNPKKRKVIVEWARELHLNGCCLPGKPGIVIAEGNGCEADEYWKRIRVLTWKRIQLKDREIMHTKSRFTNGFFEVGGTLSEKIGYLTDHSVERDRLSILFGFKNDEI